ncbi:hypothetical protein [Fibrisoma limi]|uniref:hypothetical protein n=1 Tax=Fibrisoma limi TaxID=663275 RepID=UPI0005869394|nr:hypothetical protein [Fibrisoma limi]
MSRSNNFIKAVIEQFKNNFIDIIALIVAVIAVIISIQQGESQKKMTLAGWQPVLAIELLKAGLKIDSTNLKGILLRNVGFGPAEIKEFRYYKDSTAYENKIYNQKWLNESDKFISFSSLDGFGWSEINFLNEGYVLPREVGDNKLYLLGTPKPIYETSVRPVLENIIIEIKYKSLSSEDTTTYYLRFCENFIKNNIRDSLEKHHYEKKL